MIKYNTRGGVEWQIQHEAKHEAKLSAVFAMRFHPKCCILSYNTSSYTVHLLICWLCMGGLIASALNLGLGEWVHKDAEQTN